MMILFQILKWIGIVLLWLLLFLLCVLLLVLFLPIKYYGCGTYNKEEKNALFKARWFWGLIRVKAAYPEKPYLSVKVLWFELLKNKEKSEKETSKEQENSKKSVSEKKPTEEADFESPDSQPKRDQEKKNITEEERPKKEASKTETVEEDTKEPILDKWIGIKEKIQYYIEVLTEQDTKELLAHCKGRLIKILKSIRPRKIRFNGKVGFETPDTTGYLYGVYCMISSYLGKNVILEPDFDHEIIDIKGSLKGHITVFVLLWNGLRIYFDKRLMRLIAKLKKGGR